MSEKPILIAGAGLGGLMLGLALLRRGQAVEIYEQAETLSEIGAGITVSPNAARCFYHLGLGEALDAIADKPVRTGIVHYRTGRILIENKNRAETPAQKYGVPYYRAHRADLLSLLERAVGEADPQAIRLGKRLSGLDQTADGVTARFADGSSAEGVALVGCDGIRSAARDILFGTEEPNFTGHIAWRGMVPVAAMDMDLLPIEGGLAIGPQLSFGWYPIRHGALYNYVALVDTGAWAEEGWAVQSSPEDALGYFPDCHAFIPAMLRATPGGRCFKWGLFDRPPKDRWSVGRVTLLGDAAHPTLPYMGQGAAMAFEDAIVLARCLADHDPEEAFRRYEAARHDRTALVQTESLAKAHRMQADDPDQYDRSKHRNEESLGMFYYDAAAVEI